MAVCVATVKKSVPGRRFKISQTEMLAQATQRQEMVFNDRSARFATSTLRMPVSTWNTPAIDTHLVSFKDIGQLGV